MLLSKHLYKLACIVKQYVSNVHETMILNVHVQGTYLCCGCVMSERFAHASVSGIVWAALFCSFVTLCIFNCVLYPDDCFQIWHLMFAGQYTHW